MANCNAPVATRFPVNRPPAPNNKKHPNGYLTPILKKILEKKMRVDDPEVQRVLEIKSGTKAELKRIIMLRYALNAIQGENQAIEGILDRIDGKLIADKNDNNGTHLTIINIIKSVPIQEVKVADAPSS